MDQFCEWFSETEMDDIGNVTSESQASRYKTMCIGDDTTLYDFLLLGLATIVVCFLGVFGNALSALVLIKSQFRSSVNFLLLGLTLSDTIVIIYSFATFALPSTFGYFNFGKYYNYNFFPLISPYFFPIASIGKETHNTTFTLYSSFFPFRNSLICKWMSRICAHSRPFSPWYGMLRRLVFPLINK